MRNQSKPLTMQTYHLIDLYVIGCLEEDDFQRGIAFTRLLNMGILTTGELLQLVMTRIELEE